MPDDLYTVLPDQYAPADRTASLITSFNDGLGGSVERVRRPADGAPLPRVVELLRDDDELLWDDTWQPITRVRVQEANTDLRLASASLWKVRMRHQFTRAVGANQ